jgi:hypothetical protein
MLLQSICTQATVITLTNYTTSLKRRGITNLVLQVSFMQQNQRV